MGWFEEFAVRASIGWDWAVFCCLSLLFSLIVVVVVGGRHVVSGIILVVLGYVVKVNINYVDFFITLYCFHRI